jgi:two-component system, NtrC family, response regulator AtoC
MSTGCAVEAGPQVTMRFADIRDSCTLKQRLTLSRWLVLSHIHLSHREEGMAEDLEDLALLPEVVLLLDPERLGIVGLNRDAVWGYAREELLALDAFALFPRWWVAGKSIAPNHRAVTLLRQKDGTELLVEIVFSRAELGTRDVLVASVRNERDLSSIERELEETNRYLHAIVENIPDMIFVKDAQNLAFRRFNRAGEELLGFTRGELLGKTDHDFYPKEQADHFHAKDRETFAARQIVDIPIEPITTKYKGERLLHTRKIPIYDERGEPLYLLGISEDITQRVADERALREYAAVVENLRDAVVTFRPEDGRIVSWNPGAERLYGVSSADAIGTPIHRFVREPDAAAFDARVRALLTGAEVEVASTSRVRADGREIDVEESIFVVRAHGSEERIASIARDLTELERWRRASQVLSPTTTDAPPSAKLRASPAMREVFETVDRVGRDGSATVLLLGETGVGKSWWARRLHEQSARKDRPFFEINCAALAPQLLESELFGHEKGAFTGAVGLKRGLVETAEGGTLFLDEVGELSPSVQAQLLTFLDGKTFRRVGGTRVLTADVRLVAATNVDLKKAVAAGTFRSDLYYRLSVVPIRIPPLRERREDLGDLALGILRQLGRRSGRADVRMTREAVDVLAAYDWPGNIRELRNALERALIMGASAEITAEDLPSEIRERKRSGRVRTAEVAQPLETVEREQILRALRQTNGNRTKAAELLGISRATMKRRLADMRRDGIAVPDER